MLDTVNALSDIAPFGCLNGIQEGEEQRKRVLSYEKMVLESICFDFRIIHPYKYVIKFVKLMQGNKGH